MTNNNQANQVTSLEAALKYSRMGYYPIPIRRDTKKPAIKFANKPRLTADEIKSIWGSHPEYNVALRTVKHMCIDIDIGHATGVSGYDSIKPLLGEPWWPKETLTATTATGGKHYIFAKPKDVELTQNIGALPGVDVKANINNYHLVFPSTNADGKMYNWDNWDKYSNVKPTEAPIELCEKLGAIKGNTHKCQIVENGDIIFEIKTLAYSMDQAQSIINNWKNNANILYPQLLSILNGSISPKDNSVNNK